MSSPEPSRPGLASLTRGTLAAFATGYIKKGAWNKADVHLVPLVEGEVAVKDYAAKNPIVRWLGRLQLAREVSAYRRLEGVPGVPKFHGRLDRDAIAMEYVGGIRLPKVHHRMGGVPRVAERLKALLADIHANGVIHGDLRSRDNFLVTRGGDLYVIDFSSAAVFRRGSLMSRLLFKRLRRAEERALLKWKIALVPHEVSQRELSSYRRFRRLRRLWPFNRKHDLPETKGRNPLL